MIRGDVISAVKEAVATKMVWDIRNVTLDEKIKSDPNEGYGITQSLQLKDFLMAEVVPLLPDHEPAVVFDPQDAEEILSEEAPTGMSLVHAIWAKLGGSDD